tara:strand:- start:1750 stop:2250 length:501 start_codon:yes stop_codon:yes gene_type:complete
MVNCYFSGQGSKRAMPRVYAISSTRQIGRVSFALMLMAIWSCSNGSGTPPLGQVDGIVTLDGKPLPAAFIEFIPSQGRVSWATTDSTGAYHLDYTNSKPGALLGEHKVKISTYVMPSPDSPNSGKPELVPPQYNCKTTLVADVTEETNIFNFDLVTGGWKGAGSAH